MNYATIGRIIAQILALESAFMLPSFLLCLFDGNLNTATAFAISMLISFAVSLLLYFICRKSDGRMFAREGMVCTGLAWIVLSLVGALPLCISGEFPSFIDALFEIVSGFTTTGATVSNNVEGLSRGVLYWRSFSHWLGGMGVLVFLMALLPKVSGGGSTLHLLRAESTGPSVNKLVPKMRKTASILYIIYIVLTIVNFIFLIAGGMPVFDSVCTAMGTAGTGGFGVKNDSMASYSPYLQNVTTVFMLIFGVNFGIYHLVLLGQFKQVFKNGELLLYLGLFAFSSLAICFNILDTYDTFGHALRDAAFQVSSIMTTTGFATTDFDLWPSFSKSLLLVLMLVGACAGGTGGGFKCSRLILLFKSIRRAARRALHPNKIETIRRDKEPVEESVVQSTNVYFAAYFVIIIISALIVSIDGFSIETNISAVISCTNNIGPGYADVGPSLSFAGYSSLSKIVLIFDMLVGRLEIFPILVLLTKSTWREGVVKNVRT